MAEEISERKLPILLLSVTNLFRRADALEKWQEHLLKDIVMLNFSLNDEGDGSEVVIALDSLVVIIYLRLSTTCTTFGSQLVMRLCTRCRLREGRCCFSSRRLWNSQLFGSGRIHYLWCRLSFLIPFRIGSIGGGDLLNRGFLGLHRRYFDHVREVNFFVTSLASFFIEVRTFKFVRFLERVSVIILIRFSIGILSYGIGDHYGVD